MEKLFIQAKDLADLRAMEKEALADLKELLEGQQITNKDHGIGTITEIEEITVPPMSIDKIYTHLDLRTHVNYQDAGEMIFYLFINVFKAQRSTLDEEIMDELQNYYQPLLQHISSEYERLEEEERAADLERYRIEQERKAKERAEKEEEIKRQKIVARNERRKQSIIKTSLALSENSTHTISNEYYVSLGYIAKHAKKIFAQLPDYIENWFTKEFGEVDPKYMKVSDSKKLCPSGLMSTFALALQIDLDTNDNIPAYLTNYLGSTQKEIQPISNTQFVFDIMKNEGFVFGKEQDLDKILAEVPTKYLDDFNYGYSL